MNLATIDLNRLLVLHVVLQEHSVSAAAAKLHVTPPAVSNVLAQLREMFGDQLLVRSGRGLVPTPRAVALAPRLAEAVAAISRVVEEDAFDPRESVRELSLACSDAEQIGEIPRIAAALALQAPRATLRVVSVEQLEATGGLASSGVDLMIAPEHGPVPGLHGRELYREEGVFVVRREHPRVKARVSKALFNELRHVDILLALGRGGIGHRVAEEAFAEHGLVRDIAVSAPSFTAAAAIVAHTDWITGMPRRLAEAFVRQLPLRIVRGPGPVMTFRMMLYWHERTASDVAAVFFRGLVESTVRSRPAAAGTHGAKRPSHFA